MSPALAWSEALALEHPQLDRTHEEFVGLLNALGEAAASERALPALDALLAHTEAHFALEEGWMASCGFDAGNCHSRQHALVLELMREVRRQAVEQDQWEPVNRLVPALAEWFPQHAEMMDAALVFTLRQLGLETTPS